MASPDNANVNLTDLADKLSLSEARELWLMKTSDHLIRIQKDIEEQAYSQDDILKKYTTQQYVDQDLEIGPLHLTVRTLAPIIEDECVEYALKNAKDNRAIYDRVLARRRLAHGLLRVGGNWIGGIPADGSYYEMIRADRAKFYKMLIDRADSVMEYLEFSGLTQRLIDIFLAWEQVVFNRMNGIEDMSEKLKKSTPTPQSAPSVG